MKANENHNKCGIYCIRNIVNNKVYIGKSKNIYKRIIQHLHLLKHKSKDENEYLINSYHKYGHDNFEYFVLEFLEENEFLVSERELYWMKIYDSLNPLKGYNLRSDSDSKMIVHQKTKEKISNRLKKEWNEGVRINHSKKLSDNWKSNPERIKKQSKIMSKNLTKYKYKLYNLEEQFIEECDFKRLNELQIQNCQATFHKKKINRIKFKNYFIERLIIEDIVRHSE
jgi:group I intron endonuclease